MTEKRIVVDGSRCLACRGCEIACALVHSETGVLEDALAQSPAPQRMISVEGTAEYASAVGCMHCEEAPCVAVCPTGATRRERAGGPVLVDEEKCIGCRYCTIVCPFGAIDMRRDGKAAVKCDLCRERTEAGLEPACVASCPTKALAFEEMGELLRAKRKAAVRMLAQANDCNDRGEL